MCGGLVVPRGRLLRLSDQPVTNKKVYSYVTSNILYMNPGGRGNKAAYFLFFATPPGYGDEILPINLLLRMTLSVYNFAR